MFHTFLALNPWIYPHVQSNIWGWRLFGGDWPCRQRRKFLHKKTSSYPLKSILQGRSKGWSKNEIEKATFNFFIHQFSLKKKNPSIRLFERSDMFFLTKKNKKNKNTIFKGSSSSAPGRCVLWRCCFRYISTWKPWKRRVIWVDRRMLFVFVGVLCRGSWNH